MSDRRNDQSTGADERYAGYQVYDRLYEKVGKVDGLFGDENDKPKYIGVKTDLLGSRSTLIPMDIVRVNDARRLVEVAAEKGAINDGPSFGDDAEITAEFEDRVHAHFGAPRVASLPDRGGYGAHHGEDPRVDLDYGERADARMPGAATRGPTEDLEYIPTGAGEGSSVDVAYDEHADTQTSIAPETHEGHELRGRDVRGREEELDATDAARRKARELGIDLTQVVGTGSGGRIIVGDVAEPADRSPADQSAPVPTGPEPVHAGEERGHAKARPREGDLVYDQDIGTEPRETSAGGTGHPHEERPDRESEETGEVGPGMRMGDTESGEFRGHASDAEGVRQPGSDLEDEDELRVQRSEEELRVGTREREAGSVNVRKRVRIERERIEVPTRHEEVTVERVPVSGAASEVAGARIGEDEVSMPVVEDEVMVQKRPVVKEEIRVRKDVVRGTEIVEDDVRKEEVEVEDATRRREE